MAVSSSNWSEIEEVTNLKKPEYAIPANVHRDLTEAFQMFDINGDGKISRVELGTILRSLGETLTETELDLMIKDVDVDGDGEIDLQEFIKLNCDTMTRGAVMNSNIAGEEEEVAATEALQSAFDVFDSDHDGFISAGELHRVLSSLGDDHISVDDCRYMIRCVDADGDELVNFKEFQTLMTGPARTTGHTAH